MTTLAPILSNDQRVNLGFSHVDVLLAHLGPKSSHLVLALFHRAVQFFVNFGLSKKFRSSSRTSASTWVVHFLYSVRGHFESDSVVCPICREAADHWRHALIRCSMSRCILSLMDDDLVEHVIASAIPDARLWLATLFETCY